MKKIREFMSKPITWGASLKASGIMMVITLIGWVFMWLHPIEYVRLFIAKLRNKNSEKT